MSLAEHEKKWIVASNSQIFGPVSAYEIKCSMRDGEITADDCVWRKGWPQWRHIEDIPIFSYACPPRTDEKKNIPDIPVPGSQEYQCILTPRISPDQLRTANYHSGWHVALVIGASLVGGAPGAAFARCIAQRGKTVCTVLQDLEFIALISGTLAGQ